MELDGDDVSRSLLQKGREKKKKRQLSRILGLHLPSSSSCITRSAIHAESRVLVGERAKFECRTTLIRTRSRPHEAWSSGRLCSHTFYLGLWCAKKTTVTMVTPSTKAYRDQLAQPMHVRFPAASRSSFSYDRCLYRWPGSSLSFLRFTRSGMTIHRLMDR